VQEGGGGDKERREMNKSGLNWNPEDMNEAQLAAVNKGQVIEHNTPKSPRKSNPDGYKPIRRNKYNVAPKEDRTFDGIIFSSVKEMDYYKDLKILKRAEEIKGFLRQMPIRFQSGLTYWVDFMVWENDGRVRFVEVKGKKTRVYIMKQTLLKKEYPWITVEVI
jgi:hypothetical protein